MPKIEINICDEIFGKIDAIAKILGIPIEEWVNNLVETDVQTISTEINNLLLF